MLLLRFFLSPTRFLARALIRGQVISGKSGLIRWNCSFYVVIAAFYATSIGYIGGRVSFPTFVLVCAAVVAIWRVNELVIAFFKDAIDKAESSKSRLNLSRSELFTLLALGYLEIIAQFGILHFCIDKLYERFSHAGSYTKPFLTAFDAAYFSGVTITTTGFGDFAPCRSFARAMTVYEAVVGVVLIAMALAAYLSFKQAETRTKD